MAELQQVLATENIPILTVSQYLRQLPQTSTVDSSNAWKQERRKTRSGSGNLFTRPELSVIT